MEAKTNPSTGNQFAKGCGISILVIVGLVIVVVVIVAIVGAGSSSSTDKQTELADCLSTAQSNYVSDWNNECLNEYKSVNCKLTVAMANLLDNRLQNAKDDCYHLYPQ